MKKGAINEQTPSLNSQTNHPKYVDALPVASKVLKNYPVTKVNQLNRAKVSTCHWRIFHQEMMEKNLSVTISQTNYS